MEFRISDTFVDSLVKLSNQEQKAVKTTVFDLQVNPSSPGMSFHKLDHAQDPNFASVRVSSDLRIIVHRSKDSLLLCYVDHHDDAYQWAQRRKLETHPKTGAAQLVEIRETVEEITIPHYVVAEQPAPYKPSLFSRISDEELLGYGVPPEWLIDVKVANEESMLELADHLPAEAAEALLELATGGIPQVVRPAAPIANPFDHPDALRRFRVMSDVVELERALDYPWEKWTVFLHPNQKQIVEGDYNGPVRVSGSAGTGKTIVALHRAVFLAKTNPDARVLLTTFSDALANALKTKLRRLISNQPQLAERLEVYAMNTLGERLYKMNIWVPRIASNDNIKELIEEAAEKVNGHSFSPHFLMTEWEQVVDGWQLETWDSYRDVLRLGRKTRLPESRRAVLWTIFDQVRSRLKARGLVTTSGIFSQLAHHYNSGQRSPFDFMVVDEAQDIGIAQLRFLAALAASHPNSLFFTGDLGQRIFQQPFSWKALGVDVRGRSYTLRINYRTSHQIRMQADRLLGPELSDVDGITEKRSNTISVFNGPEPIIKIFESQELEIEAASQWLLERTRSGVKPDEIGVFVRSSAQLPRARSAIEQTGQKYKMLDEHVETTSGYISLCTMHLAKGLEFRAVVVMACDDEVIPLQERIEQVTDDSDLEDVYNTERHLLYVACTRARDHLLVTGVSPASEFLDDMTM
jgi:superfamily I DNA/RNA helicase/mRNA-degrading endonuclease RelE of RelBE toxin-antitoxin system